MNNNNENTERLPIKVVLTSSDDLVKPDRSGGPATIFDEEKLTSELRKTFVTQVFNISKTF